jgi:hypothetical protein
VRAAPRASSLDTKWAKAALHTVPAPSAELMLETFAFSHITGHRVCNALSLDGEKLLETCHAAIACLQRAGAADIQQ